METVILIITVLTACVVGQPCEVEARLEVDGGAPRGTLALAVYEWRVDGERVAVRTGHFSDTLALTLGRTGTHTVTVRARSVWGEAAGAVLVVVGPARVFLPVVMSR